MSRIRRNSGTPVSAAAWMVWAVALVAGASVARGADTPGASAEQVLAREILQATAFKGGLIVHLGCGDGRLTAAFGAGPGPGRIVHGLDADPKNIQTARAHVQSLGLSGKVAVDQWADPSRLPYAENLVNLLVAEDPGKVSADEVQRALAPDGAAYVKKGGQWTRTVKPRPNEIDEWTHWLHDASGNPVAHDTVIGPPRRVQWFAGPPWGKHHEGAGHTVLAMVSARGRMFYIEDETPPSVFNISARWFLTARDAFNGVVLWRKPIEDWFINEWGQGGWGWGTGGPAKRLLVAVGDRVYLPLSAKGPIVALDAAGGEVLRTYEGTDEAGELVCDGGILVVAARKKTCAVNAETGKLLWEAAGGHDVAARDGRVFFLTDKEVVCLDLATGRGLWKAGPPADLPTPPEGAKAKGGGKAARAPGLGGPVVAGDGVVLLGSGCVIALSAKTGERLWVHTAPNSGMKNVFIIGGLVWLKGSAVDEKTGGKVSGTLGLDPMTGAVKKRLADERVWNAGHHVRCYPPKATDRYILYNMRGVEYLDLASGEVSLTNWIRATCGQGVMPANGLLYAGPHACRCYSENILRGFWALAPACATGGLPGRAPVADRGAPPVRPAVAERLERGPAYVDDRKPAPAAENPDDWPTYRADAQRSGSARSPGPPPGRRAPPAGLARAWETPLGERLSSPVAAGGKVFVAAVDSHSVLALSAETGKVLWRFMTGGRVDSPPTIHKGLALFGSADGWVYCVQADDGRLVWRFRAAPEDRFVGAGGQLESAWPVHGSVLVKDGVAYVAAGRSSFLDGGMYLYGLEPETGRVVCRTHLDGPWPGPDVGKDNKENQNPGYSIPGGRSDILVAGDDRVYMGHIAFDRSLRQQDEPLSPNWPGSGKYWDDPIKYASPNNDPYKAGPELFPLSYHVVDYGRRVYSLSGLLDDSWHNRQFWTYGRVVGQYLVFSGNAGYAVKAYPNATRWTTFRAGEGYVLYAGEAFPSKKLPPPDLGKWAITAPVFEPGKEAPLALEEKEYRWSLRLPLRPVAMVLAGDVLLLAGPPDLADPKEALAALEGRKGALLWTVSAADGKRLAEGQLDSPPVFDGLAVAGGRLYVATKDGKVLCLGGK